MESMAGSRVALGIDLPRGKKLETLTASLNDKSISDDFFLKDGYGC